MKNINNYLRDNLSGKVILQVEKSGFDVFISFISVDDCNYYYSTTAHKYKLLVHVQRVLVSNTKFNEKTKYSNISNYSYIFNKNVPVTINDKPCFIDISQSCQTRLRLKTCNKRDKASQTRMMKKNLKEIINILYSKYMFFNSNKDFEILVNGTRQVSGYIRKIIDNDKIRVRSLSPKNYCDFATYNKFFNNVEFYMNNRDHIAINTQRLLIDYMMEVLENVRFSK